MPTPDFIFFGPDEGTLTLSGATLTSNTINSFITNAASDTTSYWVIQSTGTGDISFDVSSGALSDIYINTCLRATSDTSPTEGFIQLDGPTEPIFRLICLNADEDWRAELWNGASWVQVGSDVTTNDADGWSRWDIRLFIDNASGRVVVSKDNILEIDFTGDTLLSTDTTISSIKVQKTQSSSAAVTYWAYVLAHSADISLVRVVQDNTLSNGGFFDLNAGNEFDVDETYSTVNTSDFLSATAAGQGATFNMESLVTQFTVNAVESVLFPMTIKPDADPALYLKPRVRISATNYDGTGIQFAAGTWHSQVFRYDTDPSTAVAWANAAAVDAAELGFVLSATP